MRDVFRALGDAHRYQMVLLLLAGPLHIQALADALGISQPAVSRHVRVLRDAGLVAVRRSGRRTLLLCPPPEYEPALRPLFLLLMGRSQQAPARRGVSREAGELEDYLL